MINDSVIDLYRRSTSETASPGKLVVMLYDALVDDLMLGEAALREGRQPDAHERLVHAQAILLELLSTLDASVWDAAAGLANLYVYLAGELMGANIARDAERVATCREIIEPLRDAWHEALCAVSTAKLRAESVA